MDWQFEQIRDLAEDFDLEVKQALGANGNDGRANGVVRRTRKHPACHQML